MTESIDATTMIIDLLGRGHAVRFRAAGDSMHPLVRDNDYLHVEPAAKLRIRRGDVVLTLAPRGLTAHRVMNWDDATLVTRGDNQRLHDTPVVRAHVLGVVTHAERNGSRRRVRRATLTLALRRAYARACLLLGAITSCFFGF
ncbi:MAG: hypothetical protein DMF56_22055 [Acidobacteria bacterium]|nr:MAG: hypothetical protein DMF56_22055 [Acidobacteriota bacterium]